MVGTEPCATDTLGGNNAGGVGHVAGLSCSQGYQPVVIDNGYGLSDGSEKGTAFDNWLIKAGGVK